MNEFKKEVNGINTNEINIMDCDFDCIIVDKVYDSCQQRHCFSEIKQDLGGKTFQTIRFKPGFIVPNTLVVTDIENQPNFRRVRFTLRIPYDIVFSDGTSVEKFLPDILKDTKLYIPDARDEFEFNIVVETSSMILGTPIVLGGKVSFAVGVFIITKVVGRVQLLIPDIGFCVEPRECEEIGDICENFDYVPFPDFFPEQLEAEDK